MNCVCSDSNRIILVRGNDTNFNGQQFVKINITSDVWDLSTMKATLSLGGITKTFTDLSSGIDLSYTAKETSSMPFGNIDGVLKIYNETQQVATIESLLPFKVISIVHGNSIATTPAEFNIEVKQGGETVMNIGVEAGVTVEVGTTTTLPAGSSATVTNVGTGNHLVLNFGIPEGNGIDNIEKTSTFGIVDTYTIYFTDGSETTFEVTNGEKGEQGEQGPVGPDGKDAKINGVNTLTLTATDGLSLVQSGNVATLSGKSIQDSVTNEATNRSNADNNLQQQIDAIAASSDVTDIVGTHADLEHYDTSKLKDNDIIKVLQDETDGGATTYYRWSTHTNTFTLIGEEGPYYTKGDADAKFVPQTRTINDKALDQNITLDASDVGAATAAQGAKADSAVQPAAIANMVTTNTAQTITAKKTFETSTWNGGLRAKRTTTGGSFVVYENNDGILGAIGLGANTYPCWVDATNSDSGTLVRSGTYANPSTGSATQPVYIDSNGMATAITDMMTTDTAQDVTAIKTFKEQQKIQSGNVAGGLILGADVTATTLTNGTRKLGRMSLPPKNTADPNVSLMSADTYAAAVMDIVPSGYDRNSTNTLCFGGIPGDTTGTSPDVLAFTVAKTHNATGASEKVMCVEMSKEQVRFNLPATKLLNTLATSGTISPDSNTHNYVEPTGAITLSLPASPDTTIVNEIELQVNQTSTVGFDFGTVLWGDEGTPDMSVGLWDFIFTYIGGNWCASYKKWETS